MKQQVTVTQGHLLTQRVCMYPTFLHSLFHHHSRSHSLAQRDHTQTFALVLTTLNTKKTMLGIFPQKETSAGLFHTDPYQ